MPDGDEVVDCCVAAAQWLAVVLTGLLVANGGPARHGPAARSPMPLGNGARWYWWGDAFREERRAVCLSG